MLGADTRNTCAHDDNDAFDDIYDLGYKQTWPGHLGKDHKRRNNVNEKRRPSECEHQVRLAEGCLLHGGQRRWRRRVFSRGRGGVSSGVADLMWASLNALEMKCECKCSLSGDMKCGVASQINNILKGSLLTKDIQKKRKLPFFLCLQHMACHCCPLPGCQTPSV